MEGDGPGSGDPCPIGLLLAGDNPVAIDTIVAEIAGIPKQLLFVERQAERLGMPGSDRSTIETVGTPLAEITVRPFRLPPIADVQFGLPRFLKIRLRNQLTTRPVVVAEKCRLCRICVNACPPGAMTVKNDRVEVDYRHCIRCFCCRELCPEAALDVKKGLLLRLLEKRKKSLR
ncbi:MAG TPA: 4Fe-4S dicluster domain-containing protein, partial [Geobacteraceae bacterium]|nr:4Fe-4S dicluster domain-containing protein [Geobacteraceae bacterium]